MSSMNMILAKATTFLFSMAVPRVCKWFRLLNWSEFSYKLSLMKEMGSNPVESPEFFRFMRQLLKLSSKCEDHIFI